MRKLLLFALFFILLVSIVPAAYAQDPSELPQEPLAYGGTASGQIDDPATGFALYNFSGTAGDTITVSVNSENADPIVSLASASGTIIAGHDDISPENLNALLEYTLPTDGLYLLQVNLYQPGTFTITLGGEAGAPALDETRTGTISTEAAFAPFLIPLTEGQHLIVTATATSGDLDTYVYILDPQGTVAAENDDGDRSSTNSLLEYDVPATGDYIVGVTRYGFQDGNTSGDFELRIVTGAPLAGVSTAPQANVFASVMETQPPHDIAEWTILAYTGGDNNLEGGLLIDVNEFEIAGGSDAQVRIINFVDRAPDYDTSNGDWSSARVFEIGPDSGQADATDPSLPLIDTVELFDLGPVNSGSGTTFKDFLLWGIRNYPAQNYVIQVNDHGGGWTGLVSDDTQGGNITPFQYAEAFRAATEAAGVERFALLINDACLMGSVEYLDVVAPYFDYALGAAETMYVPGYDLTALTLGLRAGTPLEQLGTQLIDSYMDTMAQVGLQADQTPSMVDMRRMPAVSAAIEQFATVYNQNPAQYAVPLGQARTNTYHYAAGSWLSFLIDAGDLMTQVGRTSNDPALTSAARSALDAMNAATVYMRHGSGVPDTVTQFNINFPTSADEYISNYAESMALANWNLLLSNYYQGFAAAPAPGVVPEVIEPQATPIPGDVVEPTLPPPEEVAPVSGAPQVTITNVYPQGPVSINQPAVVSMEVVGRNIASGSFTVDLVLPDGSARRVDTSDILTPVQLEDGSIDLINLWDSGVNDFTFPWDTTLYTLTDGTNTNIELIVDQAGQVFMSGRYRETPSANWLNIRLTFDDGVATRGITTGETGQELAGSVILMPGAEFQAYTSIVTPDGQLVDQPGKIYIVPADGLSIGTTNAPSGEYRLGFLIEAFGGATGFNSASVTVDNDNINPALVGDTQLTEGFTVLYPADWSSLNYFSDPGYFGASAPDGIQSLYIYISWDASDLDSTLQGFINGYGSVVNGTPTPITVDGYPALEFTFTQNAGGTVYTGKAFAVYNTDTTYGLVFSSERTDGGDPSAVYQTLLDNVTLFDGSAIREARQGAWGADLFTEETYYPVPAAWLPGAEVEAGWEYSIPDVPGAFATLFVFDVEVDALTFLQGRLNLLVPDHRVEKIETYYGVNHAWEAAYYTAADRIGRMYVTVVNNVAYGVWFEAPAASAADLFASFFEPMIDGYRITPAS